MRYATLDPVQIEPYHEVRDAAKREALVTAMRRDGWQGRPLLVVECGDGYQALTGSHRWAAARKVDIAVPALVIEDDDLTADEWEAQDPRAACRDDHCLEILDDLGLDEAAALMRQELEG